MNNERFIDPSEVDYLHSDTAKINWVYVAVVILDGIIAFFTGIMIVLAFRFALYGKVNQGVVSSLFSTTSIYLAIISWMFFKEALHIFHFISMVLMII